FRGYFKLYCLGFGFMMPLYAAYEFVTRTVLGGIGMSSFSGTMDPQQLEQQLDTTAGAAFFLLSFGLSLVMWAYFVAIHRRFWRVPLWKAVLLYAVAAIASYQSSYALMYQVGYYTAAALVGWGV